MIIAADIAQEAHTHCGQNSSHDFLQHLFTSTHYAAYFNERKSIYTPKEIIDAIISIAGDPERGEWTRHPSPETVFNYLVPSS